MEILQGENANVQVQHLILMGILARHVTEIEIGMPLQQYVNAQQTQNGTVLIVQAAFVISDINKSENLVSALLIHMNQMDNA